MTAAVRPLPLPSPLAIPALTVLPGERQREKRVPAPDLDALRLRMQEVVAAGRKASPAWTTGLQAVDALLDGGIPRGRITEITGTRGAGKTALLRQVVARTLAAGGWVAWIDAKRTLAAAPWTGLGKRLVMVRPKEWKRAAWCADLLLRSGVFALVVLDGAPVVARTIGFRLAQIAREKDAAFVVLSEEDRATRISGTIRLHMEQRSRLSLLNTGHSVEVSCATPSPLACRLCAHPAIPDRRGVANGTRRPWAPKSSEHAHNVSWGGREVDADTLTPSNIDTAHAPPVAIRADRGSVDERAKEQPRHERLAPLAGDPRHAEFERAAQHHADRDQRTRAREHGPDHTHERAAAEQPLDPVQIERAQREVDRIARQWSRFRRGRRRAAEPNYGRHSRRDAARERTGASLDSHLGQGWGKLVGHGRIEPKPRPSLGRVAEGAV